MNEEDLLRTTLREKAQDAAATVSLDDVRARAAAGRRRGRGRTVALVAAAAAVVAGVPLALALTGPDERPGPAPAPTPAHSPTAVPTSVPTRAPTTAPTNPPTGHSVLQSIPRGADPGITYLFGTEIHLAGGGTVPLPGHTNVAGIAAYHGGWLVSDPVRPGVAWYDNTGRLQESGAGSFRLAASPDGLEVAYSMSGQIRVGIASGMGQGERTIPVSGLGAGWPVGFLTDGTLIYIDSGRIRTDPAMSARIPATMALADAVSAEDVVAGHDDRYRGMAWSARTGRTLWSGSKWLVSAFSANGRYAAATSVTNDHLGAIAILDARTGQALVQHSFTTDLAALQPVVRIDRDGSLLASVNDPEGNRAVLRLTRDGTLSRATDVLVNDLGHDPQNIVLATGP